MLWRFFYLLSLVSYISTATAKGLDEIGAENPERRQGSDDQKEEGAASHSLQSAEINDAAIRNSSKNSFLDQRLRLSTSFGRAFVKKRNEVWRANGLSDLGADYLFLSPNNLRLSGTLRYTPISVTTQRDRRLYRGILQILSAGTQIQLSYNEHINFLGLLELGQIKMSAVPVDGLQPAKKIEDQGANVGIGTGLDITFDTIGKFSLGPRLYISFGQYQITQTSAAFSFYF